MAGSLYSGHLTVSAHHGKLGGDGSTLKEA